MHFNILALAIVGSFAMKTFAEDICFWQRGQMVALVPTLAPLTLMLALAATLALLSMDTSAYSL